MAYAEFEQLHKFKEKNKVSAHEKFPGDLNVRSPTFIKISTWQLYNVVCFSTNLEKKNIQKFNRIQI